MTYTAHHTSTFLFTDIVGSVFLKKTHGTEAYLADLQQFESLSHELVDAHMGHIYQDTGDGYIAVFQGPANAALAAIDVQREIVCRSWRCPFAVRMGIHTGEVIVATYVAHRPKYVGLGIDLAARVIALAGGGTGACFGVNG